MQVLLQILGVVVLLACVAPVAMAGGRMIAAFMLGRHILPWVAITLLSMLMLVGGGLLALRAVMPALQGSGAGLIAPLISAMVMLVPPWGVWLLGKRWVDKKAAS